MASKQRETSQIPAEYLEPPRPPAAYQEKDDHFASDFDAMKQELDDIEKMSAPKKQGFFSRLFSKSHSEGKEQVPQSVRDLDEPPAPEQSVNSSELPSSVRTEQTQSSSVKNIAQSSSVRSSSQTSYASLPSLSSAVSSSQSASDKKQDVVLHSSDLPLPPPPLHDHDASEELASEHLFSPTKDVALPLPSPASSSLAKQSVITIDPVRSPSLQSSSVSSSEMQPSVSHDSHSLTLPVLSSSHALTVSSVASTPSSFAPAVSSEPSISSSDSVPLGALTSNKRKHEAKGKKLEKKTKKMQRDKLALHEEENAVVRKIERLEALQKQQAEMRSTPSVPVPPSPEIQMLEKDREAVLQRLSEVERRERMISDREASVAMRERTLQHEALATDSVRSDLALREQELKGKEHDLLRKQQSFAENEQLLLREERAVIGRVHQLEHQKHLLEKEHTAVLVKIEHLEEDKRVLAAKEQSLLNLLRQYEGMREEYQRKENEWQKKHQELEARNADLTDKEGKLRADITRLKMVMQKAVNLKNLEETYARLRERVDHSYHELETLHAKKKEALAEKQYFYGTSAQQPSSRGSSASLQRPLSPSQRQPASLQAPIQRTITTVDVSAFKNQLQEIASFISAQQYAQAEQSLMLLAKQHQKIADTHSEKRSLYYELLDLKMQLKMAQL